MEKIPILRRVARSLGGSMHGPSRWPNYSRTAVSLTTHHCNDGSVGVYRCETMNETSLAFACDFATLSMSTRSHSSVPCVEAEARRRILNPVSTSSNSKAPFLQLATAM